MSRQMVTIDGNEAAAYVAHKINEVCAIYPITPSSNMGEWADEYSARGQRNIWGTIPTVIEMQSEGGASGAVHGALQTGALTTTFTASQGLLLMIPNMFKIAGELTSVVFHVSARTVATHALSIFGDHSDVMATRSTGWGLWASGSIQEVMDFALITQAATLESRVPIVHFFDGFRTSHEVQKIEQLTMDDMRAMIDDDLVRAHRARALCPDRPVLRGSAQNPDVFFQARETVNPFYEAAPGTFQKAMDKFAQVVGRQYHLFDYFGAPEAERVIVLMGSGAEAAHECVDYLVEKGEKVGLVKVRVYRPFSAKDFAAALPKTVKAIATLDRTKEPGAVGEPLYVDAVTALTEQGRGDIRVFGGRYGLSSKEFNPAMVKGIFDNLKAERSEDGLTWVPVTTEAASTVTISMAGDVYIGLALVSNNAGASPTAAEFSNVATTGNVTGQWQTADIGGGQRTSNSPEPLYVTIADSAGQTRTVTNARPDAAVNATWQPWQIPFGDLSGVNLARVREMTIGIGNRTSPTAGGTGTVYIDDIGFGSPLLDTTEVAP